MASHEREKTPSEIERGLERLMPSGLSENAGRELEAVLDDLARASSPRVRRVPRLLPVNGAVLWQSVALLALSILGGAYFWKGMGGAASEGEVVRTFAGSGDEIELLAQRTWIESGSDLGPQALGQAGEVSHGWSYSGVEEERLLHESSGYEVILQREFEAELYAATSL